MHATHMTKSNTETLHRKRIALQKAKLSMTWNDKAFSNYLPSTVN